MSMMWGQQAQQTWGEQPEDPRLLGQTEGDHGRIFPTFTVASAASSGEVTINGKVVRIWEYAQLETLAVPILRQRAMVIRDAIGERCPPLPSAQRNDLIQWILHMQQQLTSKDTAVGRQGAGVPNSFKQDSQARPINDRLQQGVPGAHAPFGPRAIRGPNPTRDHYGDLLAQKNEFAYQGNSGIQSMREGGEGRKYMKPKDSMVAQGVSDADAQGVQSLKPGSEGRRYLTCDDNIGSQKRDQQAYLSGQQQQEEFYNPGIGSMRQQHQQDESMRTGGQSMRHIGVKDSMASIVGGSVEFGGPDPDEFRSPAHGQEPYIGGSRKQHADPGHHMVNNGVAHDPKIGDFGPSGCGARPHRQQMGSFSGATQNFRGTDNSYQRSWKKDPSRLQGTSLII